VSATKKRPAHRPVELQRVVRAGDETRTEVTVADQIVAAVRAGNSVEVAAAAAGIAKSTLMDYLRTGARIRARIAAGGVVPADFSAKEQACADLSDRVFVAQAEFEVATLILVDRVARGGIPKETVVEKHARVGEGDDARFVLIERTTRTTHTLPDARIALQRLVFRHPDRYARTRLELYQGDATPSELDLSEDDAARIALESLRSLPAIDADSTVVED